MRQSRMPQIGDVIVEYSTPMFGIGIPVEADEHVGIVYKMVRNMHHQISNVYIHWQDSVPAEYHPRHGYCGTNIHNHRSKYRIFRAGQEVF